MRRTLSMRGVQAVQTSFKAMRISMCVRVNEEKRSTRIPCSAVRCHPAFVLCTFKFSLNKMDIVQNWLRRFATRSRVVCEKCH